MSPASDAAKSSWTERRPQVTHALVSTNNHELRDFNASYVLFFFQRRVKKTDTYVLKRKFSLPTFLCFFFSFFLPFYHPPLLHLLPWPQGAVSYLDAGALLWALIDCLCAPHSQSGQSAWGPGCLPYLPLLSRHTLRKKTGEKWREWSRERVTNRERAFIKGCPSFQRPAVSSSVFCPFPSLLLVLLAASNNQWCT